jgi:hypothetical protein
MKLSGKKDPVADISGKYLRNHSVRDTDGAILWLGPSHFVQAAAEENLSGP